MKIRDSSLKLLKRMMPVCVRVSQKTRKPMGSAMMRQKVSDGAEISGRIHLRAM